MTLKPQNTYDRLTTRPSWQYVGGGGSISYQLGTDEGSATEVHDIDYNDLYQASIDILGWSKQQGTGIFRKLPAQHPYFSFLYANRITDIKGIGPRGQVIGRNAGSGPKPMADFKLVRLTVNYGTPPYYMAGAKGFDKTDPFLTAGTSEDKRFLIPSEYDSDTKFAAQRTTFMKWPAEAPAPLTNQPIKDTGGATIAVTKQRITFTWVQVPDHGLFPGGFDQNKTSPNIDKCIGRVNSEEFLGYPRGTVLFEGWKPMPRIMGIPSEALGLGFDQLPRSWDVKLQFSFFDPKPLGDENKRGHNLAPCPKDRKWYRLITNVDNATDTSIFWKYQEEDLRDIFKMNLVA